MPDLDHAAEANNVLVIDFVTSKKFSVIAEVPEKPVQLPQRFVCAVEAPSESVARQEFGLKHREHEAVIRFQRVPAILSMGDSRQIQSIGEGLVRRCACLTQAGDVAPDAAPACDRE